MARLRPPSLMGCVPTKVAMTERGSAKKQEIGRYTNNRAENSYLPFRRRERAMLRFRQMRSLQKFASVHASLHNHFAQETPTSSIATPTSNVALPLWRSGRCLLLKVSVLEPSSVQWRLVGRGLAAPLRAVNIFRERTGGEHEVNARPEHRDGHQAHSVA